MATAAVADDTTNLAVTDSSNSTEDVEYDATTIEEAQQKFEFFWRKESGFSQWHNSSFEVDGHTYTCAEQFMMHQKAGGLFLEVGVSV